jgi:hypothetical protein
MKLVEYTYTVVQYIHDPGAGETMNIGVLLFAPGQHYLKAEFCHTYERLSKAFVDFDGEHFKRAIRRFEHSISRLAERWTTGMFAEADAPADVETVAKTLWPDPEMSFRYGETLTGITENLDETLASIYYRMVTSQYEKNRTERRSDDEVWASYNKVFMRSSINHALQEHTFVTDAFEVKFEHSFKNGSWHALQPLSLDYADSKGIQTKVTKWLGTAVVLEGNPDLDTLYLLLGPPISPAYQEAYQKAKILLSKRLKVKHRIIEERDAETFATELAGFMREHGVLTSETSES